MITLCEKDYANLMAQREQALALLSEADEYLRDIRAENLDGSEPALGELLERCTTFFIATQDDHEPQRHADEGKTGSLNSFKTKH